MGSLLLLEELFENSKADPKCWDKEDDVSNPSDFELPCVGANSKEES
jgi:hypothetical protein